MVHDIQTAYRKLLNCISRPGIIESIEEESKKISIDTKFFKSTLVLMFMLLDSEVSFKVISEEEIEISKLVHQLTYAKNESIEKADFIFILEDFSKVILDEVLDKAKTGDLINPHKSATVIIETREISNDKNLLLTGPGIKNENYLDIEIEDIWIEKLREKNSEFPRGIDLVFTDSNSNLVCLPRTTSISRMVR